MRVLLILVDGMRPDALLNNERAKKFISQSAYDEFAQTVIPSVTLPCHVSLFHSVEPSRHGTTTNVYSPQVRPVKGICEITSLAQKKNAIFYNWEELRDLSRPGSMCYSFFASGDILGYEKTNDMVTDEAIDFIKENYVDFAFLYLGALDHAGHDSGWLSDEYYEVLEKSWNDIDRICDTLPEDYTVIVTADHGGHCRNHGADIPEDMTIPIIIKGKDFEPGSKLENSNIMDIAPTIANLLGLEPDAEWEGKSLI